MKLSSGLTRWAVIGVAVLILGTQAFGKPEGDKTTKEGKRDKPKAVKEGRDKEGKGGKPQTSEVAKQAKRMANSWAVMNMDPVGTARKLFDLSEQQNAQLDKLSQDREVERAKLINELNDQYAVKIKDEVLAGGQKAQFEQVTAALNEYRAAVQAAQQELAASTGLSTERISKSRIGTGPYAARAVGLSKEQEAQFRECEAKMKKALEEAKKNIQRPADKGNKEAWKTYSEAMRAAHEKAKADFQACVDGILTAEQKEKLADIDASAKVYQEAVKAATEAFKAKIMQIQ